MRKMPKDRLRNPAKLLEKILKGKSRLPCELAGYLKLGAAVIITDQDHRNDVISSLEVAVNIILHHHEKWERDIPTV
jgi:response regulator RpfG family c-di-GMP phosphodiesterase